MADTADDADPLANAMRKIAPRRGDAHVIHSNTVTSAQISARQAISTPSATMVECCYLKTQAIPPSLQTRFEKTARNYRAVESSLEAIHPNGNARIVHTT